MVIETVGSQQPTVCSQQPAVNKIHRMKKTNFSMRRLGQSFKYAWEGILSFFRTEQNAIIHLLATIIVVCLALVFRVTRTEAIALILSMGFVWATELFNTAIENMVDMVSTESDTRIKVIKDISAAAVLVAAFCALLVGCIVFIPKISGS
jgi:diacylglycerol kinase